MKSKLLFILTFLLFPFFSNNVHADENEHFFVVTAYYSPLPDQEHYSYNVYTKKERTYEEEKRLQWEWIRWASWKKVFSWMLAAPKNYKFWTKIYLDWLWIWEVADRWGAIVSKWVRWYSYDRIDIWMWYGDEWLKRASYWGKRTIKWSFVDKNSVVNLDYNVIPSPDWVIKSIANNVIEKPREINIFDKKLTTVDEFKKLQEILNELSFYDWDINWDYKSIIDSVYNFQLSKNIVKSVSSPWAWSYWPLTRKALKNEYSSFLDKKEEERLELVRLEEERKKEEERLKELAAKYNEFENLSLDKANDKLNLIWTPVFWEVSQSVRELQVVLKELWYFENKDTAIYWNITKNSIISYQIDNNIISSKNDLWAWIVWPKTRDSIKNDLKELFLNEIVELEKFDLSQLALIEENEV